MALFWSLIATMGICVLGSGADDLPTSASVRNSGRQQAGVYFRLSQKGVDYVTNLVSAALPELLVGQTMPPIRESSFAITNVKIENFDAPDIAARFVANSGVAANLTLPRIKVNGMYEVGVGWFSQKGKFRAELKNLSLLMEVVISEDSDGKHLVQVPLCNGSTDNVAFVFGGGMSTTLNLMRNVIEKRLVSELGVTLCQVVIDATKFLEKEKNRALLTTLEPPTTVATEQEEEEDEEDEALANLGEELCAEEDVRDMPDEEGGDVVNSNRDDDEGAAEQSGGSGGAAEWGVDATLRMGPEFSAEHVVFGIDGGVVHYGAAAHVERPQLPSLPLGTHMAGFLVSDYVPNTFFSHAFDSKLGRIQEQLRAADLPGVFKPVVRLLCRTCEIRLTAEMTDRPTITIGETGVRLDIKGDVSIVFDGPKKIDVVNASAHFDITVKPYVRRSRVYGDVSLTSVDVNVKRIGIGGIFGGAIEKLLNVVVPRNVWPRIKRRLRFALKNRGIKLPVLCGVELENLSLGYIDRAILIDTDFTYNMQHFISKFRNFMRAKLAAEKKKAAAGRNNF